MVLSPDSQVHGWIQLQMQEKASLWGWPNSLLPVRDTSPWTGHPCLSHLLWLSQSSRSWVTRTSSPNTLCPFHHPGLPRLYALISGTSNPWWWPFSDLTWHHRTQPVQFHRGSTETCWMFGLGLYCHHIGILSNFKTRTFAFCSGPASFITHCDDPMQSYILVICSYFCFKLLIQLETAGPVPWDLSKMFTFS